MQNATIDLKSYSLPDTGGLKLTSLFPAIPRNTRGVNFDIYDYNLLFNDEQTLELIRSGRTIGCFYIESPGMRQLLKRLDVHTFEMLTAASSIIRPGVAESGMMQEFIARHRDPSRRKYLHPLMEKYLGETYGVMIYQEDVIKVAHYIAGLTLDDSDLMRRAMSGKARSHSAMVVLANKFVSSCRAKGMSSHATGELWRQIESFAGYSFCKAHSASFALLSYQVAYLKAHHPAEFIASVLNNGGGFYSAAVYVWEGRRMGLNFKLPSINESEYHYAGFGKEVRIGLMAVKNLSKEFCEKIIYERKENGEYKSLPDFLVRVRPGPEEAASLIKCGAMDCFGYTSPTLLRLLNVYLNSRKILDEFTSDLFVSESFRLEKEVVTDEDYSIAEKCSIEYETFGYMVTRHPLEFFSEFTAAKDIIKAADMGKYDRRKVKMIGWYMASKRITTKKGEAMKFLSLEDMSGTFEAVIFPRVYAQVAENTMSMGPYLVEGRVDVEGGNNLVVDRLEVLADIKLRVSQNEFSPEAQYSEKDEFREEDISLIELNTEKLVNAYAINQ
jgi:DNA polymerase III alpha subunit